MIVVAGTGTGVGKTYVTAALIRALRDAGLRVCVRKPVQSFAAGDARTDADVLGAASGESPEVVCPPHRWLAAAMAPPMAAEMLARPPFTIADLAEQVDVASDTITLVETAGGVASPIACDGDSADLVHALAPTLVVLVADAGLGTINLVRMSVNRLRHHRVVAFLNRCDRADELHRRNEDWLRTREGLEIETDLEALSLHCIRLLNR